MQVLLGGISFTSSLSVNLLFGEHISDTIIMEVSISRLIAIILAFIIYLFLLGLILHLKKEFDEVKKSQWLVIISIPIISMILIISIMEIILIGTDGNLYLIFLITAVFSVIGLNVLIFIFMGILNRNNKLMLKYRLEAQQRLYEEKNIDNIKNMFERIRILKHDMKHYNDSIMSKIVDMPEISQVQRKYISEILAYVGDIDEMINSIKSTIYTENKFIDSLLNYKIGLAVEKNIKVEVIVDKNITGVSDVDLCCILGNLLDNAIEACENGNIKDKIIVLHITVKNSCLLICVKNSISESVICNNPNLNTSKRDREIHGMGIKSIKSIAEKYSGTLRISEETDREEIFFIVEVLLFGENKNK
jgi:hypothetical protein